MPSQGGLKQVMSTPLSQNLSRPKAFAYMVDTPKEVTRRFEEQARVQKE